MFSLHARKERRTILSEQAFEALSISAARRALRLVAVSICLCCSVAASGSGYDACDAPHAETDRNR
jgi:hypothetical protein